MRSAWRRAPDPGGRVDGSTRNRRDGSTRRLLYGSVRGRADGSPRSRTGGRFGGRTDAAARVRRREAAVRAAFLAPAAAFLLLFLGRPLLDNITTSLRDSTAATLLGGTAPFTGPDNHVRLLASEEFRQAAATTVLYTAGSLAAQFTVGLALALFFQRRFPLGRTVRSLMLLPWLMPLVATGTVWRWMLDTDDGVVNGALRALHAVPSGVPWLTGTHEALWSVILVNTWVGIPFNTALLYAGLQAIPPQVHEAARVDGAGPVRLFRSVTWPLLRPTAGVVLVLGAVYTLRAPDVVLALTGGGPAGATRTLAALAHEQAYVRFDFGRAAATGNVLVLVSLGLALLHLRAVRRARTP
ncbi:carbohydrate ABC transporter permease [Streptomyces sp. NPDC015492]|uniref:carbohydrate ABC transporter permease n=1 Tax=Streptomyces sp. NPDC015492 TaxID=3364958 RepID=UPI00370139CF